MIADECDTPLFSQGPEVVRVMRPLDFDEAIETARAAWRLDYGVMLRTVLVRDSLGETGVVERYEVTVLDRSPLVRGESDDDAWGAER